MYILKAPNAAGSKIVVTSTASNIFDLITAAASAAHGYSTEANGINLHVEDGDIRYLMDGNTPTATNGVLVKSGSRLYLRGVPLKAMKLIRVTANVNCSVEIGRCERGEASSADYQVGSSGIQNAAAKSSSSGTVAADTTAGGTQIVAANANRNLTQCQNLGGVDAYYGAGTVTSSYQKVAAGGEFVWLSQEALKVLSSSGSINICFTDYLNT